MGMARKAVVAEAYCAELRGVKEAAHLIEETWDGEIRPAGDLFAALRKVRRTGREVSPGKPNDAAELVEAGYDNTAQVYRWVWLSTPLTERETAAIELATVALDRVHN